MEWNLSSLEQATRGQWEQAVAVLAVAVLIDWKRAVTVLKDRERAIARFEKDLNKLQKCSFSFLEQEFHLTEQEKENRFS